jgi:DNA-binding PadR family transcriptional regulator
LERTVTIQYALLGLLSWRPLSGYDLKKIVADSTAFYWSGNNNQIYKALVQLHAEGLVELEVQEQANYPARKEYRITQQGAAELRRWVLTQPEPAQFRSTFLMQLAWADQLDAAELDGLLARYEHAVEMQLLMLQERERRGVLNPARTPREAYLWREISAYFVTAYAHELAWVRALRQGVTEL